MPSNKIFKIFSASTFSQKKFSKFTHTRDHHRKISHPHPHLKPSSSQDRPFIARGNDCSPGRKAPFPSFPRDFRTRASRRIPLVLYMYSYTCAARLSFFRPRNEETRHRPRLLLHRCLRVSPIYTDLSVLLSSFLVLLKCLKGLGGE